MIAPARTAWPSPALIPSRWPTLSRPFFELEPAFLCAIGQSFPVRRARAALGSFASALVLFVPFAVLSVVLAPLALSAALAPDPLSPVPAVSAFEPPPDFALGAVFASLFAAD